MKHKLSITLDEELVLDIIKTLSTGKFRNKSHLVEYAVKKLLEQENNWQKTSSQSDEVF
jgi:Arc/MetJ-type ribon-helix-helix transcriptional regulator